MLFAPANLLFYHQTTKEKFTTSEFKITILGVQEVLMRDNVVEIGIYDDFNCISTFRLSLIDSELAALLSPIKPIWVIMGKVPANRLDFLKRQHEHKLIAHAGGDKLYELVTNKNYYWIGPRNDINSIVQSATFVKCIKRI